MEIKIGAQIMMESSLPFIKVDIFLFEWKPNEHTFLTLEGYLNGDAENYHQQS